MAKYRVAFDGEWQGTFGDREDAFNWAREVGETGAARLRDSATLVVVVQAGRGLSRRRS
jgi:hypothetical protein